jgi:hypothetical protein
MAFFKLSLGFFFLRIVINPRQRMLIRWVLIVFTTYSFGYLFYAIFRCGVPSGSNFWHNKLADKCTPPSYGLGSGYTHSILTAGTDFIFLLMPIPLVLHSKLLFREKVTVASIMILGTM